MTVMGYAWKNKLWTTLPCSNGLGTHATRTKKYG